MTLLAESTLHTLDPFVVRISGDFGIRWYGLAYVTGFVAALALTHWLSRTRRIPLPPARVADFITVAVLGVLVGGRLGHAIFYDPELLISFSGSFPFWELLAIHHGGMSSHGGILGVFAAMWIFGRRNAVPFWSLCDTACFIAPAGLMLGRLANWVNGELPGKALPPSMQGDPPWWSVKYPEEAIDIAVAGVRDGSLPASSVDSATALAHAAYAGDANAAAQIAALVPARYPNNFIQAATDGPLLMLVLVLVWWKPRHAGTLFGAFLIAYGLLRNVSEQYRVPDPDILTIGPVTLPMLLSAAMVLAGILLIRHAKSSAQPLVGGRA